MAAFYLLASGVAAQANPDALYRQRENLASARQAAEIWAKRAAAGKDFEASWKLARASYWLGTHGEENERRAALEQGVKAAEQSITLNDARPEGHFWQAANLGALAEMSGMWTGLRSRGRIKDALERVIKIDPKWQQGSADRALGWWYHKVPGLFGGSEEKAEQHLRKALSYNPRSTVTLYFLAEVLLERGRKADALAMLQQVLDAPLDPEWTPEDKSFKATAARRLKELKK
jgi:tetratricopeptide (TPR) repeat protein